MQFIIDRIEEGIVSAELENGAIVSLPPAALPRGLREGDLVKTGRAPEGAPSVCLSVLGRKGKKTVVLPQGGLPGELPACALPPEAGKGNTVTFWIDSAGTAARRAETRKLEDDVWAK